MKITIHVKFVNRLSLMTSCAHGVALGNIGAMLAGLSTIVIAVAALSRPGSAAGLAGAATRRGRRGRARAEANRAHADRRSLATRTTRRPSGTRTWPRTHDKVIESWSRRRDARTERGPSLMTRNGPLTCVGVTGFEPATSSSRTKRAAKLRYTPACIRRLPNEPSLV